MCCFCAIVFNVAFDTLHVPYMPHTVYHRFGVVSGVLHVVIERHHVLSLKPTQHLHLFIIPAKQHSVSCPSSSLF